MLNGTLLRDQQEYLAIYLPFFFGEKQKFSHSSDLVDVMASVGDVMNKVGALADNIWHKTAPIAKTALHWGFIPSIIVIGMTCTDPKPSLGQLLGPM